MKLQVIFFVLIFLVDTASPLPVASETTLDPVSITFFCDLILLEKSSLCVENRAIRFLNGFYVCNKKLDLIILLKNNDKSWSTEHNL